MHKPPITIEIARMSHHQSANVPIRQPRRRPHGGSGTRANVRYWHPVSVTRRRPAFGIRRLTQNWPSSESVAATTGSRFTARDPRLRSEAIGTAEAVSRASVDAPDLSLIEVVATSQLKHSSLSYGLPVGARVERRRVGRRASRCGRPVGIPQRGGEGAPRSCRSEDHKPPTPPTPFRGAGRIRRSRHDQPLFPEFASHHVRNHHRRSAAGRRRFHVIGVGG